MTLYGRIERLCRQEGITITEMCRRSGANRASLSDLKVGRKSTLSPETLAKIAKYFGTTVDYVFGVDTQAEIDDLTYQINALESRKRMEKRPDAIHSIEEEINILSDLLEERNFEKSLVDSGKKNKPAAEGDGLEYLSEKERALLHSYRTMTEEQINAMDVFIRGIKNAD